MTTKPKQRLSPISGTDFTGVVAQAVQLEIKDSPTQKIKIRRQKLMKPMMYRDMQILSKWAFINLSLCLKMKQLKYISIIGILILNSCSNSEEYKIEKNFKSVVDNQNCQINYYYPKIISNQSKKGEIELNQILEKYADYEHYAHRCDEKKDEKRIIKGDYKITLKTEDKLSIEFITQIIQFGGNQTDTVYHSIVLNPKNFGNKEFSYYESDPKFVIENFDRGNLYKYVEEYNEKNKDKVNLLAYESNSNYVITWGISKDNFLLYVGGEGEWFGNDKIEIPLNELKKENKNNR